jgi:hypothetical protein
MEMKPLLITDRSIRAFRSALTMLVLSPAIVSCGVGSEPVTSSVPPQTAKTTAIQDQPVTTEGVSIFDSDPGYEELGGWWLVPQVNVVVRGRLSGIVDRYEIGDPEEIGYASRDIWALEVIDVLLGSTEGSSTLRLAQYPLEDIRAGFHENQQAWNPGDEGIFFLVPAFGSDAVPDLYVAF